MRGVWGRRAAIPGHAAETFWEGVWGRLAAVTSGKWIRGELHRAAARGLNGVKARQGKSTNKRSESLTYFSFPRGSQLFSLLALPRTRGELKLLFPLYFLNFFSFSFTLPMNKKNFFPIIRWSVFLYFPFCFPFHQPRKKRRWSRPAFPSVLSHVLPSPSEPTMEASRSPLFSVYLLFLSLTSQPLGTAA